MIKILKSISLSCLSVSFAAVPFLKGGVSESVGITSSKLLAYSNQHLLKNYLYEPVAAMVALYETIHLQDYGLSKNAFEYACKGYQYLIAKKKIANPDYITICDFSQPSRNKRLYVIDLKNNKLLINTYVAHGRNSGGEYATRFSNRPESLQSSLGFYITENTYYGEHGLSLKIEGVDRGFNDRATQRKIVVHGAKYIDNNFLRNSRFMGRSFGCPAVPQKESTTIINTIKNGTCFFIYHPTTKYLHGSKILNG
ncbi:MAG TPA: murein L,D-transpeptidase catalytic domain family protein [Chitinophagaceae bacterium]|nr:murein L,D-transpeptidase catalytic domain family protein [Chitinophagaceae bacterium]